MNWNMHTNLVGQHAFLSPSQYYWIYDDDEKLLNRYKNAQAAKRGTELHEYAATAIRLGRKQPKNKDSVNMFINDAIGLLMDPEQILYYSENCFGTADAIGVDERRGILRIHDLKTGETPAKMDQLKIYAALFFMEYKEFVPERMETQLRIYQGGEIIGEVPDPKELHDLIKVIIHADKVVAKNKFLL